MIGVGEEFSIFVFLSSFFPTVSVPVEKERKRKSEERKSVTSMIGVGQQFSIFVFLSSFFPAVSVPVEKERKRKKEK
jgi:hypothetical protein